MVTDSLRYWVTEMHVDGFRFDLGTILAREDHGFVETHGFLQSCQQDPVLSQVKLIAEPWDIGPGGYQVGGFAPGWAEWNDKFRDTVRAFWKGDEGKLPELATRLSASSDAFNRRGRKPWSSVNFIHRAMMASRSTTLFPTTISNNEANGEDNKDGHSDKAFPGTMVRKAKLTTPEIKALRCRQMRNLLSTLLLSQGTPMLLAGDELGRTQNGNNNAYAQDNEISWLDWNISDSGADLIDFVRRLIALRSAFPILRRSRFLTGEYNAELEVKDVRWLTPAASDMDEEQWRDGNARCFGMLIDGRAQATGIKRPSLDATVLLVLNAHHDVVNFKLPEIVGGHAWRCLLDTNVPDLTAAPRISSGNDYQITGRSLVLFALQPDNTQSVALTRAREALRQVAERPIPELLAEEPAA